MAISWGTRYLKYYLGSVFIIFLFLLFTSETFAHLPNLPNPGVDCRYTVDNVLCRRIYPGKPYSPMQVIVTMPREVADIFTEEDYLVPNHNDYQGEMESAVVYMQSIINLKGGCRGGRVQRVQSNDYLCPDSKGAENGCKDFAQKFPFPTAIQFYGGCRRSDCGVRTTSLPEMFDVPFCLDLEDTVQLCTGGTCATRNESNKEITIPESGTYTLNWSARNLRNECALTGKSPKQIDLKEGNQFGGSNIFFDVKRGIYTHVYTCNGMYEPSRSGNYRDAIRTITVKAGDIRSPRVTKFRVDPAGIETGDEAILSWNVENAQSVIIEPGIGRKPASGEISVSPSFNTNYRLRAQGEFEELSPATADVTLNVTLPPRPTVTLTAEPQRIKRGQKVTLRWNSTFAKSLELKEQIGFRSGTLPAKLPSGEMEVTPDDDAEYSIIAFSKAPLLRSYAQAVVHVIDTPGPKVTLTADEVRIKKGDKVHLSWLSSNARSVSINQGVGVVRPTLAGSVEVAPDRTTTYEITAEGMDPALGIAKHTLEIEVIDKPGPIASITIDPKIMKLGETANLRWTSRDAKSLIIDQGIGAVAPQGSLKVSPKFTTRYTIVATGDFPEILGTAKNSVTIQVLPKDAPPGVLPKFPPEPEGSQEPLPEDLIFTELPAKTEKIDLKINGADGPLTMTAPATLNITWNLSRLCLASGSWLGVKMRAGEDRRQLTEPGYYTYRLFCPGAGTDTVRVTLLGNEEVDPGGKGIGDNNDGELGDGDGNGGFDDGSELGGFNDARFGFEDYDDEDFFGGGEFGDEGGVAGEGGVFSRPGTSGAGGGNLGTGAGGEGGEEGDGGSLVGGGGRGRRVPFPWAEASASLDGKNFSPSLRVTQGEKVNLWLAASYDVTGNKRASRDETGRWTSLLSFGGRCDWNSNLNQGEPDFETSVLDPQRSEECNLEPQEVVFNDPPGVYRYGVLRLVQNNGKISRTSYITVAVLEVPPPEGPPVINLRINGRDDPEVIIGAPSEYAVSWKVQNADRCEASGSWSGNRSFESSQTFAVSSKKELSYSLTCFGRLGTTTKTVFLKAAELPVCTFTALPTILDTSSIFVRQSVLNWKCQFANQCRIDPRVDGEVGTFGTVRVSPEKTTKYTLTCSNLDGNSSFDQIIEVR